MYRQSEKNASQRAEGRLRIAGQRTRRNFDLISTRPSKRIVMLSGEAGITPLMSMLRYVSPVSTTSKVLKSFEKAVIYVAFNCKVY